MAKRRRLTPAGDPKAPLTRFSLLPRELQPQPGDPAGRAPETKAMYPFGVAPAPISREAADASAMAALQELADEVTLARDMGRLVQELALDAVDEGWLVRDRLSVDAEELETLRESIRAHGQRTAIEVVDHGKGTMPRYGLISGWRRLAALRELHRETGEDRFAHVLAVLRRPETAGDAYVAMVEENEIRAGLSYYERARIAAKAVEAGVFPNPKIALQRLYASASRSRRSKIGSFLTIHEALGDRLRFPAAIPERLGLALAMRIEAEPVFATEAAAVLEAAPRPDAAAEQAVLARALKGEKTDPVPAEKALAGAADVQIAPGLALRFRAGEMRLSGKAVDADLRARLAVWLAEWLRGRDGTAERDQAGQDQMTRI